MTKIEACLEIYPFSLKALKIYSFLSDGINLESIKLSELIINENDSDIIRNQIRKFIIEFRNKTQKHQEKLNSCSMQLRNLLKKIIEDIDKENINLNDIYRLTSCFYLYKFYITKIYAQEKKYLDKIDFTVGKYLLDYNTYYDILDYIGIKKGGEKKEEKFLFYVSIINYMNKEKLINSLNNFMKQKSKNFVQYNINFTNISFKRKDVKRELTKIKNILFILKKCEELKINKRFEYFYFFKGKEDLLPALNFILENQKISPITSLINCSPDLAEEAIVFSIEEKKENEKQNNLYNDILKLNGKINKDMQKLKIKYEKAIQDYNVDYNVLEKDYMNLQNKIEELRNIIVKKNTIINYQNNEINMQKNELSKKDEIINNICYREISSKIITFFSYSVEEKERKENNKKNKSLNTNIDTIIKNIRKNFKGYFNYMQNNKINLYNVLYKIKNQRDKYNSLVHDNKKSLKTYIDLISKDNTELGKEIYFIMNNSKLLYDYAFEKENKIKENDIYQEFCTKGNI